MKAPVITKEIVDHLESLYPLNPADPRESLQEVYYKAGQSAVAMYLRKLYEKQLREMN